MAVLPNQERIGSAAPVTKNKNMMKMIEILKRREGMSYADFVDHYKNTHR